MEWWRWIESKRRKRRIFQQAEDKMELAQLHTPHSSLMRLNYVKAGRLGREPTLRQRKTKVAEFRQRNGKRIHQMPMGDEWRKEEARENNQPYALNLMKMEWKRTRIVKRKGRVKAFWFTPLLLHKQIHKYENEYKQPRKTHSYRKTRRNWIRLYQPSRKWVKRIPPLLNTLSLIFAHILSCG